MPNNITRQYQRHIKDPVQFLRSSSFKKKLTSKKSLTNKSRKCSVLKVSVDSQYMLSVEMLLDRFGPLREVPNQPLRDVP